MAPPRILYEDGRPYTVPDSLDEPALRADGIDVVVERGGATFARLVVSDPVGGHTSVLELGADWRAYPPVTLEIGPVDGRFTGDELLRMAGDHDPGFDAAMFAEALRAVRRRPGSAFEPYKLTSDDVEELTVRLVGWADGIDSASR
jgi:hypothetical protein